MKKLCAAAGLAGLLMAGSAHAAVVYDTITGLTETNRLLLLVQQNHAPMGDAFTAAAAETISSVTVQLIDPVASTNVTDAGSILVYLVPSVGNLPSATGLTLSNNIFLGSILDNSLLGNSVVNNVTLNTNAAISAGDYWLVLTSGSDPVNFHGTKNTVASTAGWAELQASTAGSAIGMPATNFSEYTDPTNKFLVDAINGYVFLAQIQATVDTPEPASLVVLGSALMGLGISRRRRSKALTNKATTV